MSFYSHLECHECQKIYSRHEINSYCTDCNQPLVAVYNLSQGIPKEQAILKDRHDMWRYAPLLPVVDPRHIISLGEGWTPLLPLKKSARKSGVARIWHKEEGLNPTGSFKARGIGMAVSKATEMGIRSFCIPTAGNAGSALAAYTAASGGEAHIYMPEATPQVFRLDCEVMGAKVTSVKGSIRDAGLAMAADNNDGHWWDITTLKEPFRLEGKKTMGYEIAEQLDWKLPDVIIYPTGGGTGLIGIWKAFREMQQMGWIESIPTRMVAVQTRGCNPVVRAFNQGLDHCTLHEAPAETMANGLRVPKAFGDKLIMKTLYESGGMALDVSEEDMKQAIYDFGRLEGIFLSPEGAAVVAALYRLVSSGYIGQDQSVVLINTGSPYKYVENLM